MIRWLVCALILSSGVAMATPERLTMSEDRLVAATQTHFYVRRDIVDNLGSYYAALHDQHLIEISLDSGEATRAWPLRRMAVSHLETDEFLMPGQVTDRPGETRDMMAILREAGAEPLLSSDRALQDVRLEDGALMRGQTQVLSPFGIRAAGRAQLGILRDTYPPIESEAAYLRADRIDFQDLYAEGDWTCRLGSGGQTLFRAGQRIILVPLMCEDATLSGAWGFHAIIIENTEN